MKNSFTIRLSYLIQNKGVDSFKEVAIEKESMVLLVFKHLSSELIIDQTNNDFF